MEGHVLLLLPFLALTSPVVGSTTSNSWTSINRWRYGGFGSPFSSRARTIFRSVDRSEPWSPLWTDTGTVPNLISQVQTGVLCDIYCTLSCPGSPRQATDRLPTWDQHPTQRHVNNRSPLAETSPLVAHSSGQPLHGDHRGHGDRGLARCSVLPLGNRQHT